MTLTEAGLNQAGVEALSSQRREPAWFLDLRRRAWRFFEEIAWPTGQEEEWRRTRLTGLNIDEFREVLYKKVRELHVQKYPYNDFLYQDYE